MSEASSFADQLWHLQASALPVVREAVTAMRAHLRAVDEQLAALRATGLRVEVFRDSAAEPEFARTRFRITLAASVWKDDAWMMAGRQP